MNGCKQKSAVWKALVENKKVNEHRNQLWWNSYDYHFQVSIKEKKQHWQKSLKKHKNSIHVHRNQLWLKFYDCPFWFLWDKKQAVRVEIYQKKVKQMPILKSCTSPQSNYIDFFRNNGTIKLLMLKSRKN